MNYDKNFEPAEDYELWSRISDIGIIENLPEILLSYRMHTLQISSVKKNIQNEAADKVRLKLLQRLISFQNKSYNEKFAIDIMSENSGRISCDELLILKKLLVDIYESNNQLKLYDKKSLENLLKEIWNKYVFSTYNYRLTCLPLIFPGKYWSFTKIGFLSTIKFFFKSLIGYKSI